MAEHLDRLKERLKEIRNLNGARAVLSWDRQTQMPPGGTAARAEQLSTLARLSHEMFTSEETKALLDAAAEEGADLPYESDDAALLRVTSRDWEKDHRVPADFVAEVARHGSISQQIWANARAANDYASFAPCLEKTIEYSRRLAEYLGYDEHPYDALFGQYEPGMKTSEIRTLFDALKVELVPLVRAISERADAVSDAPIRQPFDEGKQEEIGVLAATAIGYDFSRGRQDRTVHPFATRLSGNDVRITTRYETEFLSPGLFGTMHEAGHAIYEQGVAERLDGTPLGSGASLVLHESQSRLWENIVGRSRSFWQHFYPTLQSNFPEALEHVDLDTFYRAVNKVQPSFIRVEADEVTYTLHIMLRFEMELGLLDGSISVEDAPRIWNEKMREYLGITPPTDTLGILQDVHWSHGLLGYFPTYALGTILSAQLFDTAVAAYPQIPAEMCEGRFDTLRQWLTENVYQHGRKFEPAELIERTTGRPLEIGPYMAYLNDKFGAIYGF